ncbi:hypothetical protein BGZ65_010598, partial [Modicella reniformis]
MINTPAQRSPDSSSPSSKAVQGESVGEPSQQQRKQADRKVDPQTPLVVPMKDLHTTNYGHVSSRTETDTISSRAYSGGDNSTGSSATRPAVARTSFGG